MPTIPATFLCYRRADEPFATALLGMALIDRIGESRVFLDTVSLDRGRALEAKLIAAARSADVMLVVNERSGIGGLSDMAQVRPAPHDRSPADHRRDSQGAAEETGDHALVGASAPTA